MKTVSRPKAKASTFVADLASHGRYDFTIAEMREALSVSEAAARLSLSRLARKGLVASPARGFYVILPPEYKRLGCLPGDQFIPQLMTRIEQPYYVALMSAAEFYGTAHHGPQTFQVALAGARRPISCGSVRVSFITRKRLAEVPVQMFNTPRGEIRVSSAEATAIDVIGYEKQAGGLDNVATILDELAEHINPELLAAAAHTAPITWAQRLGYLLELAGATDKALSLKKYVRRHARYTTSLLPDAPSNSETPRAGEWRLRVNAEVESEA